MVVHEAMETGNKGYMKLLTLRRDRLGTRGARVATESEERVISEEVKTYVSQKIASLDMDLLWLDL